VWHQHFVDIAIAFYLVSHNSATMELRLCMIPILFEHQTDKYSVLKCLGANEGENDSKNQLSLREAWKERVWYYLAFCVDGGLMPGVLNIKTIAKLATEHDLPVIDRVLANLLYLRPLNWPHQQTPLNVKMQDAETMKNFRCNERVLERLLSTGYIHHSLKNNCDTADVYSQFIVSLLRRTQNADECTSIKFAVCRQIADSLVVCVESPIPIRKTTAPQSERLRSPTSRRILRKFSNSHGSDRRTSSPSPVVMEDNVTYSARSAFIDWNEASIKAVIPALIEMIKSESLDEKLKVIAVVGLVNFTRKQWQAKEMVHTVIHEIIIGDALKYVSPFILSKHEDLARHTCSFLISCCQREPLKQELQKNSNFVKDTLSILTINQYPPYYRSIETLLQATSLISSLAMDTAFRTIISDCLGYEQQLDPSHDEIFEQSVAIRILVDVLKDDKRTFFKHRYRDRFFAQLIGALKNLSLHHNVNRKTIGRLSIPMLLLIIATDEKLKENTDPYNLVEAALRCICVLTFHRQNCQILKKLNIDQIIDKRSEEGFLDLIKNIGYMCSNV